MFRYSREAERSQQNKRRQSDILTQTGDVGSRQNFNKYFIFKESFLTYCESLNLSLNLSPEIYLFDNLQCITFKPRAHRSVSECSYFLNLPSF